MHKAGLNAIFGKLLKGMHFKHPELLYFLFLLLIPVIVHLFQLRRFEKEYFTNVKFLKEITSQTRKSSTIKKWLLLINRLLIFFFLILAFSQPFWSDDTSKLNNSDIVIAVDNSFSMQAQGQKGELLPRALYSIIERFPSEKTFTLILNNEVFHDVDLTSLKGDLSKITYCSDGFSIDKLIKTIDVNKNTQNKQLLIVTDGFGLDIESFKRMPKNVSTHLVMPEINMSHNVSVDSVYVKSCENNFCELAIDLTNHGELVNQVNVSVLNKNKSIAKLLVDFDKKQKNLLIKVNNEEIQGKVSIQDKGLKYDNDYYFTLSKPNKGKVISIGESLKSEFLSRIYTKDEFEYQNFTPNAIDYSILDSQEVIVLNELDEIPTSLQKTLQHFVNEGGQLVLIPSEKSDLRSYNQLLGSNIYSQNINTADKQLVTQIHTEHPLFNKVFTQKISQFDYPYVQSKYSLNGVFNKVLSLQDQNPFLISIAQKWGRVYVFNSPLHNNSNIKISTLIVPVFGQLGLNKSTENLSLQIGSSEPYLVNTEAKNEKVFKLIGQVEQGIPLQQIMGNKVKLTFEAFPYQANNFKLTREDNVFKSLSFNYKRNESVYEKPTIDKIDNVTIVKEISDFTDKVFHNQDDNGIWRWLVLLTFLFLVTEIFIQKFVK